MKLAFVLFILGFMVIASEQQWFPYHMPSRVIPPWAMLDALSDRDLYSYLTARKYGFPLTPYLYGQPNVGHKDTNAPVAVENSPFTNPEEQFVDAQSRNKFDGIHEIDGSINPRFLFNFVTTIGSTNSFYNPLQKTIYYFTTATTTITFTTTCISTAQFAGAGSSATVTCRKRRELLEFFSVLSNLDERIIEAEISPSNVQENHVMPTARAMPGFDEQQFHLSSSMDEDGLSSETLVGEDNAANERYKRLFISTTIVTTYVFTTVTTTRTLASNLASTTALTCRPSQFTYC